VLAANGNSFFDNLCVTPFNGVPRIIIAFGTGPFCVPTSTDACRLKPWPEDWPTGDCPKGDFSVGYPSPRALLEVRRGFRNGEIRTASKRKMGFRDERVWFALTLGFVNLDLRYGVRRTRNARCLAGFHPSLIRERRIGAIITRVFPVSFHT